MTDDFLSPPLSRPTMSGGRPIPYQNRVDAWMRECFDEETRRDLVERSDRLVEETLELAQTVDGWSAERAHALVDYVFGRPVGEPGQEVGGVMVCLAAFCNASAIWLDAAAETELARVWTKIEKIRAKHAAKPKGSALPGPSEPKGESHVLTLDYTNHRGNRSLRRIIPLRIEFASSYWHPEPQWILTGIDLDKGAKRGFAMKDIHGMKPG